MFDAEAAVSVRVPALTNQAIDTAELKLIAQPRLEVLRVGIAARPVTAKVTLG